MPSLDGFWPLLVRFVEDPLSSQPTQDSQRLLFFFFYSLPSITILIVILLLVICDLLSCSLLLLAKAPVNYYQSSVFHKYRCLAARAVSLVACRIRHPKLAPFLFCPSALINLVLRRLSWPGAQKIRFHSNCRILPHSVYFM